MRGGARDQAFDAIELAFGGAIAVPDGGSYKEFLLGGIFAQTVVFGCFGIAVGLTTDRSTG